MSSLSDFFLTGLITYGAPVFGLALFLSGFGVPLPSTLLVVAAGAFTRQGAMDSLSAGVFGLAGSVLGDSLGFAVGRFARGWVLRRFSGSSLWARAEQGFQQRGGLAIYLTRFLLTAVATPTNLIAGTSGYPFWRFLLIDLGGELTWIIGYGGLGYAFGSQWELIGQFLSDFSGLALGIAVLGGGIYFWKRTHTSPSPILSLRVKLPHLRRR